MPEEFPPTAFTDAAGRRWVVTISYHTLKRVKAATGVEIAKFAEQKFKRLGEMLGDVEAFVNVLWVCVEEQAGKLGVSDEDFGRALGGDALEAAADAFVRAFADFSPSQAREPLLALARKGKEYAAKVSKSAVEALEKIDVATLPLPSINSAASLPESVESIPEG